MAKLLVSVRNATEAEVALAGGADLIDVKEPARGPLGAADAATIRAVADQVAERAPISAALGELLDGQRIDAWPGKSVRFAKYGLAGCGLCDDWTERWRAALAALPRQVVPVAVVYADWEAAAAPAPLEVISRAPGVGCGAVLIDTFDKTRRSVLQRVEPAELAAWVAEVRAAGLLAVVAGGLGERDIAPILALEPDYVGVRGAACVGDRGGSLDEGRVRLLKTAILRAAEVAARS
jgi:uncharacterized protein (UPF0264 family)